MQVEISYGEWADRVSILMIKSEKLEEPKKSVCAAQAKDLGDQVTFSDFVQFHEIFEDLQKTNDRLWEVEEELRQDIDDERFLHLAKLVPVLNDKRHKLKVAIDEAMGKTPEFKSYQ